MSVATNEIIHSAQIAKQANVNVWVEQDGLSVTAEAEGERENLSAIVDRLKPLGSIPPATAVSAPASVTAKHCQHT